jgi:hypothetical protein
MNSACHDRSGAAPSLRLLRNNGEQTGAGLLEVIGNYGQMVWHRVDGPAVLGANW